MLRATESPSSDGMGKGAAAIGANSPESAVNLTMIRPVKVLAASSREVGPVFSLDPLPAPAGDGAPPPRPGPCDCMAVARHAAVPSMTTEVRAERSAMNEISSQHFTSARRCDQNSPQPGRIPPRRSLCDAPSRTLTMPSPGCTRWLMTNQTNTSKVRHGPQAVCHSLRGRLKTVAASVVLLVTVMYLEATHPTPAAPLTSRYPDRELAAAPRRAESCNDRFRRGDRAVTTDHRERACVAYAASTLRHEAASRRCTRVDLAQHR